MKTFNRVEAAATIALSTTGDDEEERKREEMTKDAGIDMAALLEPLNPP